MKNKKEKSIVVFDLDETLGHFEQLSIFWSVLEKFYTHHKVNYDNVLFYNLLDIFDLFLRPKILDILTFLKKKKEENKCDKIMIYTNNQGPKSWANIIKSYLHHKLNYDLFDQTIGAFTINGKKIEICRTSHSKSVSDLINCTKLPENTKIFFIDDQHHPDMENKNVIYIHIKPYVYNYKFSEMINLYYSKNAEDLLKFTTKQQFYQFFKKNLKGHRYEHLKKTDLEQEIDNILSKKIIEHLEDFFKNKRTSYTRKKKEIKLNTTKRINK